MKILFVASAANMVGNYEVIMYNFSFCHSVFSCSNTYRRDVLQYLCDHDTWLCTSSQQWKPGTLAVLINPFPHIDAFWHLFSRYLLKTFLQKKKKLFKMSNFSFYHDVFNNALYLHLQICCIWERVKSICGYILNKSVTIDALEADGFEKE